MASGVSGVVVDLSLFPVDPSRIRVLTHITVENRSNNFDKLRLKIKHLSLIYYLDEITNPLENELIVSRSEIVLGESDILQAECTGTIDNDILVLTALGWEMKR